jgi:hypothetical protein
MGSTICPEAESMRGNELKAILLPKPDEPKADSSRGPLKTAENRGFAGRQSVHSFAGRSRLDFSPFCTKTVGFAPAV